MKRAMKKAIFHVAALAAMLLGAGSCSKEQAADAAGECGRVVMNLTTTRTDDGAYDPFERMKVRIYNADGGLIRKYDSQEAVPASLELLAGEYSIDVELGEELPASFEARCYRGSEQFTVTAGLTTEVEVECRLRNTVVEVLYDQTIAENFDEGFLTWVAAGEQLDPAAAEEGSVAALRFTESGKGYLLLPEGVTSLSWLFRGNHPEKGVIEKSGRIDEVKAAGKYQLSFRYSADLPGFIDFTLRVDTSTDDFDDTIIFSPDPTITGDGFNMKEVQKYTTGERRFLITTMGTLSSTSLRVGSSQYDLLHPTEPGISSQLTSETSLTVTLGEEFLSKLPAGSQTLTFDIADEDGGQLTATSEFRFEGLIAVEPGDYDLWNNTVTLRAMVFDSHTPAVRFSLRRTGANGEPVSEEGQQLDGSRTAEDLYTATFTPRWEESTNEAGLTVYTPAAGSGIFANAEYEYGVTLDGTSRGSGTFSTTTTQSIPDGGMENGSLPCFGVEVSSNSSFWASGNNSFAKTLCTQGTFAGMGGSYCAKLASSSPPLVGLAAGNLLSGLFYKDGLTTGVVEFGQPYTWQARPRALRVKYHATVGTVNNDKGYAGPPIKNGDQDRASIYACIVDWSARHKVSSGTSAPTGAWNPSTMQSTDEGAVIGYAMLMLDGNTEGETMLSRDIEFHFYDHTARPSGTYTIVLSCSANAYGEYMLGCTSNVLYVDDFEWVY